MPTRNYRQAKRAREASKKVKLQQKLDRKSRRGDALAPVEDALARVERGQEDVP